MDKERGGHSHPTPKTGVMISDEIFVLKVANERFNLSTEKGAMLNFNYIKINYINVITLI